MGSLFRFQNAGYFMKNPLLGFCFLTFLISCQSRKQEATNNSVQTNSTEIQPLKTTSIDTQQVYHVIKGQENVFAKVARFAHEKTLKFDRGEEYNSINFKGLLDNIEREVAFWYERDTEIMSGLFVEIATEGVYKGQKVVIAYCDFTQFEVPFEDVKAFLK